MSVFIRLFKSSTPNPESENTLLNCARAELEVGDYPADNIAVVWAKKAMLLLQEMIGRNTYSFYEHIECPCITLEFYSPSLPSEDEIDSAPTDVENATIQFRLSIVGEETIGWQMTPTFYFANILYETLSSAAQSISVPVVDDDVEFDDGGEDDYDDEYFGESTEYSDDDLTDRN